MRCFFIIVLLFFLSFYIFPSGIWDKVKNDMNADAILSSDDVNLTNIENQLSNNHENIITFLGRVQIYGNEPHTFVGIIDENHIEYAVYSPAQEGELKLLQGHLIKFTVILLNENHGYGGLFLKGGTVEPIKWEIIR